MQNAKLKAPLFHPKYRPDIDGLRAIAVLSVVGFHAFPGIVTGGFIGVDIFFVISGYLISTILYQSMADTTFSFWGFYGRRIRRIFPALITVLIAVFFAGWLDLLPDEFAQLGLHIAGGAAFISNFILWNEVGYFDVAAEVKPLLHLWSLGIEEQFYIVWPAILWIAHQRSWRIFHLVLWIGGTSFFLNVLGFFTPFQTFYSQLHDSLGIQAIWSDLKSAVFYLPITRFWELFIGSALAYLAWKRPPYFQSLKILGSNLRSTLGLILLIAGLYFIKKSDAFPGWWALLPTLGAALLLSAKPNAWFNRFILSVKPLVWIGVISYPLYLWHWPLLSFAFIMADGVPPTQIRAIAVILAFILAWLTYLLVEKPLRFGGSSQLKTWALIIAMIFVGILGLVTKLNDGFAERVNPIYRAVQAQFKRIDAGTAECVKKYPGGGNSFCRITDIDRAPTAAIIGDSHAGHFYWGLAEYYKKNGGNLINLGAGACPPFYYLEGLNHPNIEGIQCKFAQAGFEYILNDQNIKTVYLAFHHSEYFRNDIQIIYKDDRFSGLNNYSSSLAALVNSIRLLEASGKKVIILYDMPSISINIKKCFSLRPFELRTINCPIDKNIFIYDFDQYNMMLETVKKDTGAEIFQTHSYLEGNFPITKNKLPAYVDKDHLSVIGSLFFADKY